MTILYVVGRDSKNDNQELRWSLRSLDRFAHGTADPFVVGYAPDWYTGPFLPRADIGTCRERNILDCVVHAVGSFFVGGEFLLSADDHFHVRDTDFDSYPRFYRTLECEAYREGVHADKGVDLYYQSLGVTRDILLDQGYPAIDFSLHSNVFVNAADMGTAKVLDAVSMRHPYGAQGMLVWALLGNLALVSGRKRPLRLRKDVKLAQATQRDMDWLRAHGDCFSINDEAFESRPFLDFMAETFPHRSRWER